MYRSFNGIGGVPSAKRESPKSLSISQEARKGAIEKLQIELAKGAHINPVVQAARLGALIKLLSNEYNEENKGLRAPVDMMHFTEKASNDSNINAYIDNKFGR